MGSNFSLYFAIACIIIGQPGISCSVKNITVKVKEGWLQGFESETEDGVRCMFFKGIPYARPPIGHLRFRDPRPCEPWAGVKFVHNEGFVCPQSKRFTNKPFGNEDCLYLNIGTKSLTKTRPVMVWIHGGAFMTESGNWDKYNPRYLMREDIVYVSFNYRIGALGFLHLDHELAPGNYGMKDQVMALRWVNENIAQFGGDPNNITIFGQSAGAFSIHYHLSSPLSRGLFHRAIIQSGVAFSPWSRAVSTVPVAHELLKNCGKETRNPGEIVDYLRTIPAIDIVEAQSRLYTPKTRLLHISPFGPGIDSKSRNPFMPRPLEEIAEEGFDIPVLIGYTSEEGIILMTGFTEEMYSLIDESFENSLHPNLIMKARSSLPEVAARIRYHYFGKKKISPQTTFECARLFGDQRYLVSTHRVVEIQMKKSSPTYLYKFSYDNPEPLTQILLRVNVSGTSHFEDIMYLFPLGNVAKEGIIEPGSTKELISNRFVKMWTNFATFGDPTPRIDDLITVNWQPVNRTAKNYMIISSDLQIDVNPDEDILQFWRSIDAMCQSHSTQVAFQVDETTAIIVSLFFTSLVLVASRKFRILHIIFFLENLRNT